LSAFQLPLQLFPRHDSISMSLLRPGTPSSPLAPHMCACLLPPARPGTLRPHHTALIGSPSHILVPTMLRSLVGALFRSHVPALRRPSSFLMIAPSRSAVPALPLLSVPPSCCTHPGRLERMPQRTRSSRCSSLPPPPIVGTGAADQGQQRDCLNSTDLYKVLFVLYVYLYTSCQYIYICHMFYMVVHHFLTRV
jgi:hypothetical protein